MAATNFTPISLYYSTTAAAVPLAANLVPGELAINIADGKLYFENSSGVVTLLAQSSAASPVSTFSAGTTGFTPSTATSGAITLAGTLVVGNGGTGATTLTGVLKGNGTSAFSAATAGTDYLAPPSGTAILKANSGGALANATAGTDYAGIDTAQTFTKGQRGEITGLTDGTTITPDFADSNNFSVTLGGNRTLANPSNIVAGQSGSFFITQDATGSRTLAYGSYYDFAGGTAPTLSTAANAVDRIDYVVRTATSIHAVFTANYS